MSLPKTLTLPESPGVKTAVIELDVEGRVATELSYKQLARASSGLLGSSVANTLRKGETAVLLMPNGAELVAVGLALLSQGVVVLPLNPALKPDQVSEVLEHVKPSVIIGTEENIESLHKASSGKGTILKCPKLENYSVKDGNVNLENFVLSVHAYPNGTSLADTTTGDNNDIASPGPDDPAVLLFTSGTTSSPKGVILTHRNILTSIEIISKAHQLTEEDNCMLVTPLFHVAGFCASMLITLVTGGTLVIQPPGVPSANFWQHLIQHRITWFHAVPALLKILLKFQGVADFKHAEGNLVRFVRCGGSPLSTDLMEEAEATTGKPLLEIYGLTESSPGIFCNRFDSDDARQAGTFPIPSQVQLRIMKPEPAALNGDLATLSFDPNNEADTVISEPEVGELCIRGPSVITRYVYADAAANASAFDAEGFFHTGDLARRVGPGGTYVQLRGRIKEAVNKGGEKINPVEVDNAILQHEAISEVACFAAQDEEFGEDICKYTNTSH